MKQLKHYLKRIKEDGLSIRFWISNLLTAFNISLPTALFFDKETNSQVRFTTASAAHKIFRSKFDPSLNKAVFKHFVSEGGTVFDVGANIGMYTIFSARLVGSSGSVYAFEPTKESFQNLLSNITLNRLGNVVPVFSAVSDTNGLAEFIDHDQSKEQNYLQPKSSEDKLHTTKTLTARLDTFMSNYNVSQIDFLKIDVEGAELPVLRSLGDKLSSLSAIFFEVSSDMSARYGYSVADIVDFLERSGFEVFEPQLEDGQLRLSKFSGDILGSSSDLVAVSKSA